MPGAGGMGGRLGVRMEKVLRKEEDNGPSYSSRPGQANP